MDGGGAKLNTNINNTTDPATCKVGRRRVCLCELLRAILLPALQSYLASVCVANASTWNRFQLYSIPNGGKDATPQCFTDYTAEFLLTRGPYALLG